MIRKKFLVLFFVLSLTLVMNPLLQAEQYQGPQPENFNQAPEFKEMVVEGGITSS